MDVVKICIIFFPFIMLATSCNQKKTVESVSTSSVECRGEPLENRFIVQWEDGSFTVERGNNMEDFRSTFIKDNLAFIKHVDHDYNVRVAPLTLNSDGNTSSAATLNWGPISIQAPQLWAENILGDGVIVGVIDGMVDVNHAQLRPNILVNNNEIPDNGLDDDKNGVVDDYLGAKFTQQVNDPVENTHGSHVAGIIAADSSKGPIQGVAPKVKIIPAQFIGNKGEGAIGDAITAMNYAVSRGAKILNLSWGGAPCIQTLASAMENFSAKGILLITAAGNGDKYSNGINVDERPNYPSAFGLLNQINVAAATIDNFMIYFSNFGLRKVHVAAPGVDIESTIPGNRIATMSGTSMAAPMTAGAAALLWSAFPTATSQQIKLAILRGVEVQAGHEFPVVTKGQINVKNALAELKKLMGPEISSLRTE